ncbi:uncharacterized protein dbf4b [Melanotaenia boesemani]|uniref:uncharacterized protein dbf4b n=1 Tax=Melanotaenia boesemani TaxID=1250792 RepID=UPI001C03C62A|nr:uncharacterized protein dbf4b [Melanotaenia boesemani]XP_041830219.1 uncharacterized protein dbf4b [Melanotaenia boesemani]
MESRQLSKEQGLLGRLSPGEKKLKGKTFYLDNVRKRSTALLLEAISFLGGRVESFLHKDVSFVLTGSHEGLQDEKCDVTKGGAKRTSEGPQHLVKQQESGFSIGKQPPGTPRPMACGSRGKALLEKAIRNNERLQKSCVLSSARSWGVKILFADDVLLYLKQLTRDCFSAKQKRTEKSSTKQSFPSVKAAALRSPYLKIEDSSRKYKPLHMQSMTFPALYYSGRFSPFESPPPPRFEKQMEQRDDKTREKKDEIQDKSLSLPRCNPSAWRPRKKDLSYCECCRQSFSNLEEHLQTDQHRLFVLDHSNYRAVDQLVAEMLPGFDPSPSPQRKETLNRPPTPLPIHDICELEPLTDVEMEQAVMALHRHGSSYNTPISSPKPSPLSSDPVSPLPGVNFTVPNPDTLAAYTPFSLETGCQFSDIQPHASSPAMPVLTVEPQAQDQLDQRPEVLSPCPIDPCPFLDPYSLPPVLSPQVPYFPHILDDQCPYSEPPILSPQKCTMEETWEGHTSDEMNIAECMSTVSLSVPLFSVAPNAEKEGESNPEELVGFSGLICSSRRLKCAAVLSQGSHSLPCWSAVAPNPNKRCRSASSEQSQSKRRKMASFRHSGSRSDARPKAEKQLEDKKTVSEGCLLFEKDSCITQSCLIPDVTMSLTSCSTTGLKQTCTTLPFPAEQYFTQVPNPANSVDDQPSCLLPSKAKTFDPLLDTGKTLCAISSQDSQRSLAHSTSVCIEPALIPDLAMLSSSSSDSDWDCDLLSHLDPTSAAPQTPMEHNCELDKELLHRPCPWMHNTSYESHLHTVLQPPGAATSLCGEDPDPDPSAFSRTVVQIVEVQH